MRLMNQVRECAVPKGETAVWWLGQNGWIFKSHEGTTVGVDLYLTDSCATLPDAQRIDLRRAVPVLVAPEELELDVFACTHNHQDHTDPDTIRGLRNKDTMLFLGPPPSCESFTREGVESGRTKVFWPKAEWEFRDLKIRGTFALPTDSSDLCHMGFVLEFAGGPRFYITGDTDYHELLLEAASVKPDFLITCINGGFNNLSHWEAAALAKGIRPRAAVPCHYDMFRSNSANPRNFEAALALQAPETAYHEMRHGQLWLATR
jgi:L-ascorbate 6-phosphate lactonase